MLSQGKLCFAKIAVLGAAELPLRIEVGGLRPSKPPWGFCVCIAAPDLANCRVLLYYSTGKAECLYFL